MPTEYRKMADNRTLVVCCDFSSVSDEELKVFIKLIAPHADINRKMRDESICARVLLKYVLYRYFRVEDFTLCKAENGKPFLKNSVLQFNFSHCLKRVVCAVSESQVGCDVQDIRPFNEKVTKRFFAPEEYVALSLSDEKDEHFTKLWTLKEAILKYKGDGISGGLSCYRFDGFLSCESFSAYGCNFYSLKKDGFIYGICSETENITVFEVDIKDILKNLM